MTHKEKWKSATPRDKGVFEKYKRHFGVRFSFLASLRCESSRVIHFLKI